MFFFNFSRLLLLQLLILLFLFLPHVGDHALSDSLQKINLPFEEIFSCHTACFCTFFMQLLHVFIELAQFILLLLQRRFNCFFLFLSPIFFQLSLVWVLLVVKMLTRKNFWRFYDNLLFSWS